MRDPIKAHEDLKSSVLRYISTAFGARSGSFEEERKNLLMRDGGLFREQYIEPIASYQSGARLGDIEAGSLRGLSEAGAAAFKGLCLAGLIGDYPLYSHQQKMLETALAGKNAIVTTGTGSGKTEAFLLPMIASIVREMGTVEASTRRPLAGSEWVKKNGTKWDKDKRRDYWGEKRPAAIRSLLLYPMNALVEDQLSRLRQTLDSDPAHEAYRKHEDYFGGNRITFARFNGETPVPGHPFKKEGGPPTANTAGRTRLRERLKATAETYEKLRQLYETEGDPGQEEKYKELLNFFPRVDDQSTEMLHRWEMQRCPPDILITNFSMLSIMLMRRADPSIPGDQGDIDMFEKTREWLASDPCREDASVEPTRVFHLIVDELHLYRGTAGTEVAYLVRLLLNRLGLAPGHPQLRILASSASLDAGEDMTWTFLEQFFGYPAAQVREDFELVEGDKRTEDTMTGASIPAELIEACQAVGSEDAPGQAELGSLIEQLRGVSHLGDKLVAACRDESGEPRATALGKFSGGLFPGLGESERKCATRGLLAALSATDNPDYPRFRMHWLSRAVEGIWASADKDTAVVPVDTHRTVGELYDEGGKFLDHKGNRILEVLYCECCGALFFAGHRASLRGLMPGQPPAGVELLPVAHDLESLPGGFAESLTDRLGFNQIVVFWPLPSGGKAPELAAREWGQARSSAVERREERKRNNPGRPPGMIGKCERVPATWRRGSLNPKTAHVRYLGEGASVAEGEVEGYCFDLGSLPPGLRG